MESTVNNWIMVSLPRLVCLGTELSEMIIISTEKVLLIYELTIEVMAPREKFAFTPQKTGWVIMWNHLQFSPKDNFFEQKLPKSDSYTMSLLKEFKETLFVLRCNKPLFCKETLAII